MAVTYAEKEIAGSISFTLDWATELGTDTISSVAWKVPATLTNETTAQTSTTATIRLSGGRAGRLERIRCHVTGASGQIYARTLYLRIGK
jgi:hypothetical protein